MLRIMLLLLLQPLFAVVVQATIYVTSPLPNTRCSGGKPCSVEWVDNGQAPLLTSIGPCHVGLYNDQHRLIQQIDPLDISAAQSLQFTPNPQAGPDSDKYYINFTSVVPVGNPPAIYSQYSAFFTIDSMSGSFDSPLSSVIASIPVPPALLSATPKVIPTSTSTSTSTSAPNPPQSDTPTPPVTSGFTTSRTPAPSSSQSVSTPPNPPSSTPSSARRAVSVRVLPALLFLLSLSVALV